MNKCMFTNLIEERETWRSGENISRVRLKVSGCSGSPLPYTHPSSIWYSGHQGKGSSVFYPWHPIKPRENIFASCVGGWLSFPGVFI